MPASMDVAFLASQSDEGMHYCIETAGFVCVAQRSAEIGKWEHEMPSVEKHLNDIRAMLRLLQVVLLGEECDDGLGQLDLLLLLL